MLSDFSSTGVSYNALTDTYSNPKGFNGGFASADHAYFVPYYYGDYSGYLARVKISQ